MQGIEECSLCGSEIVKNLIYTNPSCRHNYCYYCLQDNQDTNFGVRFCFLKKCPKTLDMNQVREFSRQCSEREIEKPLKNNETEKGVECSCCDLEVNENNPIVYTNEKCGHSFCKSLFLLNEPVFYGTCFRKTCAEQVNYENLKKALSKTGIQYFKVICDKCAKIFQQIFVNPVCQHRLCASCIGPTDTISCALSNCQALIDEEKLVAFRRSLMEKEKKSNYLDQRTVACPSCAHKSIFFSPPGLKVNYWKCPDCLQILCSQHNGPMSKCLCFCPKCLDTLNGAHTHKCSISDCLKCGKENKTTEICPCSVTNNESIQNLTKKCGHAVSLDNIPSSLNSYLEMNSPIPIFYLIGFLLTQYILSQPASDETIKLHQRKATSSFTSFIKINPDHKTKLEKLQHMIDDLSLTIIDLHPFNGNNQLSVANFIIEISQYDSELKEALEWLGRCTLVDYMVSEGLHHRIPSVFKKWKNENSKPSDIDIEDVLSIFCESFDFKIQLFYQNGDKIDRNNFGQENARYTAQVLDLLNGPLAILYEE